MDHASPKRVRFSKITGQEKVPYTDIGARSACPVPTSAGDRAEQMLLGSSERSFALPDDFGVAKGRDWWLRRDLIL